MSIWDTYRKDQQVKNAEFYERACKFAGYDTRILKIKDGEIKEVK